MPKIEFDSGQRIRFETDDQLRHFLGGVADGIDAGERGIWVRDDTRPRMVWLAYDAHFVAVFDSDVPAGLVDRLV